VVVPPSDVDGFARALEDLAAHPDTRERFGQRARDLVSAKHAVDELAPQIVEAIERTRRSGRSTP
jgi:glycosyltransferase involved in cell wall biosynthesis